MSGDTSEEKTLPPSPKKLRDLRKKGQIARSNDMIVALTMVGSLLYLWISFGAFTHEFEAAVKQVSALDGTDFTLTASKGTNVMYSHFGPFFVTLVLIVLLLALVGNVALNKGFLFSMDPLKFDLNKLNPAEGFKRMFSLRSLVEVTKNLIKIGVFISATVFVLWSGVNAPFQVPYFGMDSFRTVMSVLLTPMILAAALIFLFGGMLDIGLQQWLFKRQQKMTKTEAKRERKDTEGSPEIKASQKRLRQRLFSPGKSYSEEDATFFVEGLDATVGLRFVRGETPLPLLVCKGRGAKAARILEYARGNKKPVYFEDDFATALYSRVEVGAPLTERFFEVVIRIMRALGVL
jgi:type III secretion protein U